MISSENLDRWVMMSEQAARASTAKSRSDTPSREFSQGASKPKSDALYVRSVG